MTAWEKNVIEVDYTTIPRDGSFINKQPPPSSVNSIYRTQISSPASQIRTWGIALLAEGGADRRDWGPCPLRTTTVCTSVLRYFLSSYSVKFPTRMTHLTCVGSD